MTLNYFEDVMTALSLFTTNLEAQMTHDNTVTDNAERNESENVIGAQSTLMHAAAIDEFGLPEELRVQLLSRPSPNPHQVLVQVVSAGVQPTDAAIRAGWSPPGVTIDFPQVLGNEFSGVVVEAGSEVVDISVGDAVLGFNILGCYAEYVAVDRTQVVLKPGSVGWHEAGVLSASGQTAHAVFEELSITSGETVLVHGAAGGVGTVFTQLAVNAGATVIGTASKPNHEYVRSLGATPVSYGEGQGERIRALEPRVDAALDAAGHENLRTSVQFVKDRSRVATIVDMQLASELGCRALRSRRSQERLGRLVRKVADGELAIHLRAIYSLDQAADAHRDVESGHGRGKIALAVATVT